MNDDLRVGPARLGVADLESLRGIWGWLMVMGIALIILGFAAMGSAALTTLMMMWVLGFLLVFGAAVEVVTAFWARRWRAFFLHLLTGVLYFIAGVFLIERPEAAMLGLTLLIAGCLLVGGIVRIIMSVVDRFDGWGWMLLYGAISVLLGIEIWQRWPWSGFWVIGLFVGIEMVFAGVSWVMLALAVRSAPAAKLPA
jgi:uncharacterized membrane protein HdeD (DUF308 family)